MRRPVTWVSGSFLAAIFLGLSALVTHSAGPAPASASAVWAAAPAPPPPHHAAARADEYTRPALRARIVVMPLAYTTRDGDTFSSIARRMLGHASRWPALWYANRRLARNPDALRTGLHLTLAVPAHPVHAWLAARALAAIPKPEPKPKPEPRPADTRLAATPAAAPAAPAAAAPAAPAAPPAQQVTVSAGGFEACVIQAESGGNPVAQNPSSTASGLFGFLNTTWTAVTGLPGPARAYPAAQQEAAFQKLYAEAGTAPWAAYDGC